MGGAVVVTIVLFVGLSAAKTYSATDDAHGGPEGVHRSYTRSLAPPTAAARSSDQTDEHSVLPSASIPLQEAASSYQVFPLKPLQYGAGEVSGYAAPVGGAPDPLEALAREYQSDPDFNNRQDFLDTAGYKHYKSATAFALEGPHQLETIQSKSYHREVGPFDVGDFEHKHEEEHAEVHYHQHKHLHKHQHKQEHLHKHKQEHEHKHGHKHQHKQEHEHKHHHGHKHQHEAQHHHKHQQDHKHQHHADHKHDHHHGHKHDHSHHAEHKHEAHHGHKHDHHQEHKHDHHHGHKHDHHHGHKHQQDHHHEHKHHGHNDHHHKHEHKSKHGHHSHHKHVHKHHKYHHG